MSFWTKFWVSRIFFFTFTSIIEKNSLEYFNHQRNKEILCGWGLHWKFCFSCKFCFSWRQNIHALYASLSAERAHYSTLSVYKVRGMRNIQRHNSYSSLLNHVEGTCMVFTKLGSSRHFAAARLPTQGEALNASQLLENLVKFWIEAWKHELY